jgi:hypothetical protein
MTTRNRTGKNNNATYLTTQDEPTPEEMEQAQANLKFISEGLYDGGSHLSAGEVEHIYKTSMKNFLSKR